MSNIITIAYGTEGSTDKRFLLSIIKRTFDEIAFECPTEIDVYEPIHLDLTAKKSFVDDAKSLAKLAQDSGIHVLCIHTDADDASDANARLHKITPAFSAVKGSTENWCKNLVSIVPITMTESWMLADKELLIEEIGTEKTINDLGLNGHPELINDPKQRIIEALRIAQEHISSRRYKLELSELYQPIGQKISLEKLRNLASYQSFRNSVIDAFKELNYLH